MIGEPSTDKRPLATRQEPRFPLVAIVGRPNVGKSTLFNRLVGRKMAIVHDEPGVTRDRHYARVVSLGRAYTAVDTGGFDPESDDPLKQGIVRQVRVAVAEADVVVCVLDAMQGPTEADRQAVALLRRSARPVVYVANKVDSERAEVQAVELYKLGLHELVSISALHGRGMQQLERAIVARLATSDEELTGVEEPDEGLTRVAILGRPNVGKSSLVNRLAGEDRMLIDDRPGTTRDPIDTLIERGGKRFLLVDTAGIRRKSKVAKSQSDVELVSVLRAVRAIDHCDVVVVLCDATTGAAEQDAKILGLAIDRGRGAVVAFNKMDLVPASASKKLERDAREKLAFAPWVPMAPISAHTGRGVGALLHRVARIKETLTNRVSTSELNRFFEKVLQSHPPPTHRGRAPRLFYVTQAGTSPPLFVVMTNAPDAVHFSYQRYVINKIREHFGFEGVPIRVMYRARRKAMLAPRRT